MTQAHKTLLAAANAAIATGDIEGFLDGRRSDKADELGSVRARLRDTGVGSDVVRRCEQEKSPRALIL